MILLQTSRELVENPEMPFCGSTVFDLEPLTLNPSRHVRFILTELTLYSGILDIGS